MHVLQSEVPGNIQADAWKAMLRFADTDKKGKLSIAEYKAEIARQSRAQEEGGSAGSAGGASSLTVTTVWLGLVSTMWLFW